MVATTERVRNTVLGAKISAETYTEILTNRIENEGYVCAKNELSLDYASGDYYVYLWKHMFGEPFYIGKGKDNRWKSIQRNDSFTSHINKGDGVVYKVVYGILLFRCRYLCPS